MTGQILARKRKGFTLLEESIVIAIIALLAIPLVTLLNESIRAQVYGTKDVKGQYYANLIMQDFERRVRRASSISTSNDGDNPYEVDISYMNSDSSGTATSSVTYKYKIDDPGTKNALFYRDDGSGWQVFPLGLEKGIIQNFEIDKNKSNIDTRKDPPYYVDVKITSVKGTILQKTIYLVNYYKQE